MHLCCGKVLVHSTLLPASYGPPSMATTPVQLPVFPTAQAFRQRKSDFAASTDRATHKQRAGDFAHAMAKISADYPMIMKWKFFKRWLY